MKNKTKMKVKVMQFNSLEEILAHMAACVEACTCKNCKCEKKMPASVSTVKNAICDAKNVDLNYFIKIIAAKKGWKPERAAGWLNGISEISTIAAFSIVAREIAVYLDHVYKDHIENSERIFVISPLDGRIHEVCKAHIKNYRNFAAFRTVEDAKFACNILKMPLKDMFKENAKGE